MTTNVAQTTTESPKTAEDNFMILRKSLAEEKAKNEKLNQEMQEIKKMVAAKPPAKEDDDYDEPYIDSKKFRKGIDTAKEDIRKEVLNEVRQEFRTVIEQERAASYLKQNPDFEQTLNPDVLKKFTDKHPAMAEAILRMPDNFERQKLVYEAIKSTGANRPDVPQKSIQEQINANKKAAFYRPSSQGTPAEAPAGDFSDVGMKAAYEKMQSLKKSLRI